MSLQEKLEAYRSKSYERLPAEKLAIMSQATDDLRQSVILDRMIQPGDSLPAFALPNVQGEIVSSQALLEKGPVVVSFYRGVW